MLIHVSIDTFNFAIQTSFSCFGAITQSFGTNTNVPACIYRGTYHEPPYFRSQHILGVSNMTGDADKRKPSKLSSLARLVADQ